MSRLQATFEELRATGRKALIPFITAGDPTLDITLQLMHALVDAGANVIELGVPFSDPMADGEVVQRASERALRNGVSLRDVLGMVTRFRQQNQTTPVVLMGYLNPVEVMGYENFAAAAATAGVDGVLTVDIPPEEADDLLRAFRARDIDPIFLLSPTTADERIAAIADGASGFLYYVSVKGVTGSSALDSAEVERQLARIRQHTTLPVGVGFGISDAASAQAIGRVADAVIVGSALVRHIEALQHDPAAMIARVTGLFAEMRQAIDSI